MNNGSVMAGWACVVAVTALIFQHVLSSPRIRSWPPLPTYTRLSILALIGTLAWRAMGLLGNPQNVSPELPLEGILASLSLANYFVAMAQQQWSKKRAPDAQAALTAIEQAPDQEVRLIAPLLEQPPPYVVPPNE